MARFSTTIYIDMMAEILLVLDTIGPPIEASWPGHRTPDNVLPFW